jgi:hypothetical protein
MFYVAMFYSIAQMAGAFYGAKAIDETWLSHMKVWDPHQEIELRAMCLFTAGVHEKRIYEAAGTRKKETESAVDSSRGLLGVTDMSEAVGYNLEIVHPREEVVRHGLTPEEFSLVGK